MKITCFTESLGGGGAEHQMVILAGLLAEKGYDVSLVTYASIKDFYPTPLGVKRIDVGNTQARGAKLKAFVKFVKIFHFFLREKTDCIISYRQCANLRLLIPMFFRSRKQVKVICSDRNAEPNLSLKHKLLLNYLYKRADYIVPNSKTETEFISRYKPQLVSKLFTIHNYTDLFQFKTSIIPDDLSIIKIAIFSRYSKQKNPIGFAIALNELKKRKPHPFEVHWYGAQGGLYNGFNKDYLNLKEKIEELHIDDVLILHPAVKDPSQLMDLFHAVCLPSIYEGFSNSISEAICSGKPMLVSNVSDNPIMVHERKNGFLFDPNNIDSICSAFLNYFSLSYDEMCTYAMESRRIAEKLFDKEEFIRQYVHLIEA